MNNIFINQRWFILRGQTMNIGNFLTIKTVLKSKSNKQSVNSKNNLEKTSIYDWDISKIIQSVKNPTPKYSRRKKYAKNHDIFS